MKTINFLKLLTFSASLFYMSVNAAIPTCSKTTEVSLGTGTYCYKTTDLKYNYCITDEGQLSEINLSATGCQNSDEGTITPKDISEFPNTGLYFIKKTYEKLAETSATEVHLISVTVSENKISKVSEEKISKGNYLDGEGKLVVCANESKCAIYNKNNYNLIPDTRLYFVQNSLSGDGIIELNGSTYSQIKKSEIKKGYYLNGVFNNDANKNQLLVCENNVCEEKSAAENDVYINAGEDNTKIIFCSNKQDNSDPPKTYMECTSNSQVPTSGYFANSSDLDKATPLIYCNGSKCEALPLKDAYMYYENTLSSTDKTKVLACVAAKGKCDLIDGEIGDVYVSKGDTETEPAVVKCDESAPSSKTASCTKFKPLSENYYLNAGGNSSVDQVITCGDKGCVTKNVNPGYYVNNGSAGNDDEFIKCTLTGCEVMATKDLTCPNTSAVSSSIACYSSDPQATGLVFYEYSTTVVPHKYADSDLYIYTTIKTFPSVTNEITTLVRISKFGIERYIASGAVGVDPNNKLESDFSNTVVGKDVELYDCSTSTKVCTKRSSCQSNTYMYDSENKKVLFCSYSSTAGTISLKDVSKTSGFYIDGATVVGTRTPYVISCDNGVCEHIYPSVSSYYVNAGYDNTSNALIYCNNNNCISVVASTGKYIGKGQEGIIDCTSSTTCSYRDASTAGVANYVNAGANKATYSLIYCTKKTCTPKISRNGYYFTNSVTTLIYCESSSSCTEITPTVNYYYYADTTDTGKNYIINCSKISSSVICSKEVADTGSYLTNQSNVLVTCSSSGTCKQVHAKPGYYQSAVKITINSSRDVSSAEDDNELVSDIAARDTTTTYNIIECTTTSCELLTAEELNQIPVCEYSSDKCYITLAYSLGKTAVTSITAGNICTNADRSVFYFATDTIVVAPNVIAGTTSTYVYTTTTTNCIMVGNKYSDLYYTVGSDIFRLSDGAISHFFDTGYYFINIDKNTLVSGNNIDTYNNENVKLYKCNGTSCKILDKPDDATYYADVNKKIIKFNVNSDSYSFAYEKDITCIFANNKCTPNADLNGREFCITYKGELVLAAQDIKNRETGDCYRASSINSNIYGFNQYLYNMDSNSATVIDDNGYYLVSLSTNNTVSSKDYRNRLVSANSIRVYGCLSSICKIYEPEKDVYYYDANAKTLLKNEENAWRAPSGSGYALVTVNPGEKYVYKIKSTSNEITLLAKASSGYYYTVDNEMYECNENDNECTLITETDYYFTNTGEIYYCVYDSENLEKTECAKQSCYVGQNYYIGDNYYRCEAESFLTPIKSRNCKYDENVIVNFPTILKDEFPSNIKQAIEDIEKNNNSTAIAARSNKKYLSVVPAIFTNCTYNVEETEASYDFVCINNYVSVNDEDDTLQICSIENLGYVECVEDEVNPEKCTPSSAFSRVVFNVFTLAAAIFASLYILF